MHRSPSRSRTASRRAALVAAAALLPSLSGAAAQEDAPIHLVERAVARSGAAAGARGTVAGVSRPVLPRAAASLTDRLEPGPGAVLRFHYAAKDSARSGSGEGEVAPVSFQVTAIAPSAVRTLFRQRVETPSTAWTRVEVPLDELPPGGFRLAFQTDAGAGGRALLPLWGDPTVWPAPPDADPRPHVVLVSLDTLRARSLSTYGRERLTSPRLDALAASGTLFRAAFTTFSNTLPAHLSLFLGRYGWPLEMEMDFAVDPEVPMLGERFREAGYATAAFTENARLVGRAGFWRGFGSYYENKSIGSGLGAARDTFARALRWLDGRPAAPFLLFVHTYQVHAPYDPPDTHRRYFRDSTGLSADVAAPAEEGGEYSLPDAADSLLLYEQEVRYLDELLDGFVAALDERIPPESLLLVVTADHGEEFLEHGSMLHGQLYDETLRVPLLVRWPGRVATGRTVEQVVSLADVAPTLLDLAELPALPAPDGRSLRPLLAPEATAFPDRTLFARSERAAHETLAARTRHHKCIVRRDGTRLRCFDLRRDPGEAQPLAGEALAATRELQAELARFRDDVLAGHRAFGRGRADRSLDDETRAKLEALGYVAE